MKTAKEILIENLEEFTKGDPKSEFNSKCEKLTDVYILSMKLYANQKLDEAAGKATFNVSTNGLPLSHFYVRRYIIGDKLIKIDKQSILSLKDNV